MGDTSRKKKLKIKLRLSFDNRSVAKAAIYFPLQKLLTFCSIFADLLSPQNFCQALDAAREMSAIGTEWKVEPFRRSFLCRCRMQIRLIQGAEQLLIPRVGSQRLRCFFYL
jgi:hypothetical protein